MFDAWASDSENSDYEPPSTPRTALPLNAVATEILRRLKHRTPITVEAIRNNWRDVQNSKHRSPYVDRERVTKEVGRLIQLTDKVSSVEVKNLGDVSEEYAYEVYALWHIISQRTDFSRMASYMMWADVGKLMELPDGEAKEILWVLRDMGKKGQLLKPNASWDRCHRHEPEEGWEKVVPKDDVSPPNSLSGTKRKHPRIHDGHPNSMSNLMLEERSPKRQKFRPQAGDWQCGKCNYWNKKWWGTCHNERCNGTMGEDAVKVHTLVDVA